MPNKLQLKLIQDIIDLSKKDRNAAFQKLCSPITKGILGETAHSFLINKLAPTPLKKAQKILGGEIINLK